MNERAPSIGSTMSGVWDIFLADAISMSAVSVPPKEVQCEVQSPQAEPWLWNCCDTYQKQVPWRLWGLQVAMFLFFFPLPAQVRDWNFASILYSPVCLTSCLISQTTDLTWFWLALFLDLDINSFHHKYSLLTTELLSSVSGCCLVSQLLVWPLDLTQ